MNQELSTVMSAGVLEELQRLADIGEIAGPLAHEINNFLNVLVLNVAVLEQKMPEDLRPELQQIRRQGMAAADLVRQFQQSRRRSPSAPQPVQLHLVLDEVLKALCVLSAEPGRMPPIRVVASGTRGLADAVAVTLDLAADLPPVSSGALDLRRLLTFLLSNAVMAAAQTGGWVTVRTSHGDGRVFLRVEDTGAPVGGEQLPHFFEPAVPGRSGVNCLELAACRAIVRRLQGKIEALPCPEAGVAVVVELKIA